MLDTVVRLLSNLGWLEHVNLKFESYDRLVLALSSSLNVDWVGAYKGKEVMITLGCLIMM